MDFFFFLQAVSVYFFFSSPCGEFFFAEIFDVSVLISVVSDLSVISMVNIPTVTVFIMCKYLI